MNITCPDCLWYGTTFCDGDIVEVSTYSAVLWSFILTMFVQDLNRWWFLKKCSKGRFSAYSRSYSEVVADKRFRQ